MKLFSKLMLSCMFVLLSAQFTYSDKGGGSLSGGTSSGNELPPGSYQKSCVGCTNSPLNVLSCTCTKSGHKTANSNTTLNKPWDCTSDIRNNNGILQCG